MVRLERLIDLGQLLLGFRAKIEALFDDIQWSFDLISCIICLSWFDFLGLRRHRDLISFARAPLLGRRGVSSIFLLLVVCVLPSVQGEVAGVGVQLPLHFKAAATRTKFISTCCDGPDTLLRNHARALLARL